MGSTFLALTNRVLIPLNEVILNSSSFSTARGIHQAAEQAVLDTVRDICSQEFEWPFLASSDSKLLVVGQSEYTITSTDYRRVDWDSFYVEKNDTLGVETTRLQPISKEDWYATTRPTDLDSSTDGQGIPTMVFGTESGGFGVSLVPNQAYTVHYKYFKVFDDLVLYSDTTVIPTEWDYVINDGAMMYMYMFLDNDSRAEWYRNKYQKSLRIMMNNLMPNVEKFRDTVVNFGGGSQYGKAGTWGYIKTHN